VARAIGAANASADSVYVGIAAAKTLAKLGARNRTELAEYMGKIEFERTTASAEAL
jgi:hypothetical protein